MDYNFAIQYVKYANLKQSFCSSADFLEREEFFQIFYHFSFLNNRKKKTIVYF